MATWLSFGNALLVKLQSQTSYIGVGSVLFVLEDFFNFETVGKSYVVVCFQEIFPRRSLVGIYASIPVSWTAKGPPRAELLTAKIRFALKADINFPKKRCVEDERMR